MSIVNVSNRQRAITWMKAHMSIVEMFEKFAQQLVDRQRKFGINLLRERVRWECVYEYGDGEYKFPNDFSPYVARYLLWKHPEWKPYMTCKAASDEDSGRIVLITDSQLELEPVPA